MMPRKWNIPLTYKPKIEPVKRGECTQTIRTGRKYSVGDLIRFYTWMGKPYHSKRETITEYMPLRDVVPIIIFDDGISSMISPTYTRRQMFFPWMDLNGVARNDGIVPPTGEALRDVLISKNGKIPTDGIEAQIIRWQP
jgi:hypothetical protein